MENHPDPNDIVRRVLAGERMTVGQAAALFGCSIVVFLAIFRATVKQQGGDPAAVQPGPDDQLLDVIAGAMVAPHIPAPIVTRAERRRQRRR